MFEVAEGDELDDVPEDGLSFGRPQDPVVAVQHLHVAEVGVPDPDDDDGHGEVGGLDDGLPGVGHVGDDAVGQDQQDEVLLKQKVEVGLDGESGSRPTFLQEEAPHHGLLGVDLLGGGLGHLLDDGSDVGGTVELQFG